jgi:hypothetical protein
MKLALQKTNNEYLASITLKKYSLKKDFLKIEVLTKRIVAKKYGYDLSYPSPLKYSFACRHSQFPFSFTVKLKNGTIQKVKRMAYLRTNQPVNLYLKAAQGALTPSRKTTFNAAILSR